MRLIITLALVVGWLLVAAPPAAAHVELTAASPAQDAAVTGPLTEIRLEFNGPLAAGGEHAIGVFGPGEQRFDSGQVVEVSDRVISTAVGPLPVTGPYTVRWLVIGVDGHPIEGTYAFSYTGPVASPTTSPQPSPTESSEPSPTEASDPEPEPSPQTAQPPPGDGGGSELLVSIAGLVAGGAVVAIVLARRHGDQD